MSTINIRRRAHAGNVVAGDRTRYPLIDTDWTASGTTGDTTHDLPAEVVTRLGSADVDTAGGCG